MVRLTVWLSDDQKDWVESESESQNIEQAEVIRRLIDNTRFSDSHSYSDSESSGDSPSESTSAIESRVDDLEQRLSELENRNDERQPTARERGARMEGQRSERDGGVQSDDPSAASEPRPSNDALSGSESTADFDELLNGVYSDMEFREARREAGRAALEWLREQDEHHSGQDFKDALYDEWQVSNENPDTWWRKNARPALQAASDFEIVEYRKGHHDYKWTQNM